MPNAPASQVVSHPPGVVPVLLQGLSEDQQKNYIYIHTIMGVSNSLIRRATLTKAGNCVITPASEADKATLLATKLPGTLTLKDLADRPTRGKQSPFIVLRGVNLAIDVEIISRELGLPCSRLLSTANEGKPTMKVKVKCLDHQRRKLLLSEGATVGFEHFKASAYEGDSTPTLQCFKCFGIGHIAQSCSKALVCRKCGGAHMASDCTAENLVCTNCQGPHAATDRSCTHIIAHRESTESKRLTYAAVTSKPADKIDSLRLAACIASTLIKIKSRDNPTDVDICNDAALSVAHAYKTNLTAVHVQQLLNANAPTPQPHNG